MVTPSTKPASTKAVKKTAPVKVVKVTEATSAPKVKAGVKPAAKATAKTPAKVPAKSAPKTTVQPVEKLARKPVAKKIAAKPAKPAPEHVSPAMVHLKASTAAKAQLTLEERHHYVSVAAFYIAERRGFTLGSPADDWLAAEAEVDRLLASGHFPA